MGRTARQRGLGNHPTLGTRATKPTLGGSFHGGLRRRAQPGQWALAPLLPGLRASIPGEEASSEVQGAKCLGNVEW